MTAKAVMSSHKNLYGEFNTRRYTLIQGFASLNCFLWLVKRYRGLHIHMKQHMPCIYTGVRYMTAISSGASEVLAASIAILFMLKLTEV